MEVSIRIFKTREEAVWAQKILDEGEIDAQIVEDTFNNVPIQNFGVTARFRLKVHYFDYLRAAEFLAHKLKGRKRLRTL